MPPLPTPNLLTSRDGTVLTVAFSRPDAANALTPAMYDALADACQAADADPAVRCLVLCGNGDSPFPAGTDIRSFAAFSSADDGTAYEDKIGRIVAQLADVRVPTIAVIRGHAVGAGLMLAAACDIRICTAGARFGVPIARTVGNCLSQSGYDLLADRLGSARLLRMLLTAQLCEAEELHASGFLAEIVSDDKLESRAAELCELVSGLAPLTIQAAKLADCARRQKTASDIDFVRLCYGSRDFAEGVRAFLGHQRAAWTGE
jgi:enoyl-CoA hydratase/carnithine racemase